MAGDTFQDAARLVASRARRGLPFEPDFRVLERVPAPPAVAVDGSHAVLVDTGAVWAVAVRAAAVMWPGPPRPEPEPVVHAVLAEEAEDQVRAAHEAAGLRPPERVRSAEAFAEAHRELAETLAARAAARAMAPGSLLLLDGTLHGLLPEAQARTHAVAQAAKDRGLHVVGVAKRARMDAGAPLGPLLHRLGEARLPGRAWAVPLPDQEDVHVARLHGRAPFTYRVDADGAALPLLVDLCRDAVYLGYPYPLAVAHNAVAITHDHAEALLHRLQAAVRQAGGAEAAALLQDPHAMLDENVPG